MTLQQAAFLFATGVTCCALACAAEPPSAVLPATGLATIESLDVQRYMGTWYEIAKFPNRFQSMCHSDTRAQYTLQANGSVQVINSCRLSSGEGTQAVGEARQIGTGTSPRLQVRFAPAWLSAIPWVWGDYWVIDLDPKYQLAAVSEPQRKFLWILSRTPTVGQAELDALMTRLTQAGFDLRLLELSRQTPP